MPINVRPLRATDRDGWLPLWLGYLEFYGTVLPDEVTEATWRRLTDPAGEISGLAAVVGSGRIVGLAHFLFHPVTWSVASRCYLEDLFVAPDLRGEGVGQSLIEAVYRAADAAGADQVYWLTAENNDAARRLYDRVGRLTRFIKYQR